MGKRGPESYMKRQKEIKRKQKAQEKMDRRQGRKMQQAADTGDVMPPEGEISQEGTGQQDDQNQDTPAAL